MKRILFAGGGTAGHITPAKATADKWHEKYPADQISFLGTKNGLERKLIPASDLILIPKVVAPRKISFSALLSPFQLLLAVNRTISIVKEFDLVVGFGGYVSGPAYLAAALLRKPIVIHEANAKPGLANRIGSKFSKEVGVAYELARLQLPNSKVVGNPLNKSIVEAAKSSNWESARTEAKLKIGAPKDKPMILILGGSQGARAINQVIAESNLDRYFVLHSIGAENKLPNSTENYRAVSYLEDMANALLAADLVISRSGALACTEIAALARYALFIPLPIGNGEQALNAQALLNSNKAELVMQTQFTSDWLALHLPNLMASALAASAKPAGTELESTSLLVQMMESSFK